METTEEGGKGFFKHVFNFDTDSKGEMLNLLQYTFLALIPVIVLNKLMQRFVPEADEEKGNVEILGEIVIQIIVMFLGLLLIHRIVSYVPTYSGIKQHEFHVLYVVLPILMITLSLQTKLGEKVNILLERLQNLWEGDKKDEKKGQGQVKVKQPISQPQVSTQNQSAFNQSIFTDGTSIHQLPSQPVQNVGTQQQPNYNNMYKNDSTPLVNAASPMENVYNEPMAANMALGGSAFSTW